MHLTGGVHNVGGGSTGHGKVYPFQFRAQKIPGGGGVCQSPLEERIFRALVRNRAVVSFEIRPLRIPYRLGQQVYYFTPTLLVHYADGRKVLVEVKARQTASDPASQAKFHAAAEYAAAHDMAFEVWAGPAPAPATGLNGATGQFSNGVAPISWTRLCCDVTRSLVLSNRIGPALQTPSVTGSRGLSDACAGC
ncbi:TnsA endonuclease N-terminal domain-containing protein, partial [Symbiobacterium terraclitae]|uniref:TnsA endonuclease N-terminal domain-containing protein n=1 Tax=Symbiobacterium terraclitae TaxID=557451 RepID=UPI0035B555E1